MKGRMNREEGQCRRAKGGAREVEEEKCRQNKRMKCKHNMNIFFYFFFSDYIFFLCISFFLCFYEVAPDGFCYISPYSSQKTIRQAFLQP